MFYLKGCVNSFESPRRCVVLVQKTKKIKMMEVEPLKVFKVYSFHLKSFWQIQIRLNGKETKIQEEYQTIVTDDR